MTSWISLTVAIVMMFLVNPQRIYGEEESKTESFYQPSLGPLNGRSVIWRPALSLILPGFDQWISGQYGSASIYTLGGLASREWAMNRNAKVEEFENSMEFRQLNDLEREYLQSQGELYKQHIYAHQLVLAIGGMSAYHSFRTSALIEQKRGAYQFLKKEETPLDLLAAPFDFSHLKKPTTLIPLALITGLAIIDANTSKEEYRRDSFTNSDALYTGLISYNAGTYEEAIFRGWLMPVIMESSGSAFWSNLLQSTLFAAAHLNQISTPYVQFGLGFYFGWLTQHSDWTLSESIFIHAWWDVAALAIQFQNRKVKRDLENSVIWLPPFKLMF